MLICSMSILLYNNYKYINIIIWLWFFGDAANGLKFPLELAGVIVKNIFA